MSSHQLLQEIWYGQHPLRFLLWPFSKLFEAAARARRSLYLHRVLSAHIIGVPVIVVGNISVGGTGKSPLTIWLYHFLRQQGYTPGIISHGYGGRASSWPQQVRPDSDPVIVGDEAVLIARQTSAPMAVAPDRVAAARALVEANLCDILISDDGLQHYRLGRQIEIAVVDGVRRHGNGRCLPLGPLREPLSRLKTVDLIVTNGIAGRGEFAMRYAPQPLVPVNPQARGASPPPANASVHAVAGIGHPDAFFSLLRAKHYRVNKHAYTDHHAYCVSDINFEDNLPVIMTEKDAVKCESFADARHWALPVRAELPAVFAHRLLELLKRKTHEQKITGNSGVSGHQRAAHL